MKGRRALIVLAMLVVLGVGVHAAKKKKNAVTADTTITHKVSVYIVPYIKACFCCPSGTPQLSCCTGDLGQRRDGP